MDEGPVRVMMTNVKMLLVVLGVALMGVSGCASMGSGGSGGLTDEALIVQTLTKWQVGLEAPDIESFLAAYSDSYEGDDGVDKGRLTEVIGMIMDAGYLDDVEVDLEGVEIMVDGTTAEVEGIVADGPEGEETNGFALEKEADGVWRIVRDLG